MRGLDTNVLVRYLTQDDPAQSRKANAIISDALAGGQRCAVGVVVLCELVWVLRDAYGFDKNTVAIAVERILDTAQFFVEDKDVVRRALEDYRRGAGDFSDHVIGWRSREAGCTDTVTFDRELRQSELFTVL